MKQLAMLCVAIFGVVLHAQGITPLKAPKINKNKVLLGDNLFHDKRFSADGQIACSSCHDLQKGGSDGLPRSPGVFGRIGVINTPTVFNSSLNFVQFWDGRAKDLAEQMDGPIANPKEMASSWPKILKIVRQDKNYRKAFQNSYQGRINKNTIKDAIVHFEKALITTNAPFDRYLKGYTKAISPKAQRGYQLFTQKGCTACHQGPNLGGTMFQKMGLVHDYFADRKITEADLGRYQVTKKDSDKFFFKVPGLRNISLTGPYFHDGHSKTLEDAVEKMGYYQLGLTLSKEDVSDIVAFLNTLNGGLPTVILNHHPELKK